MRKLLLLFVALVSCLSLFTQDAMLIYRHNYPKPLFIALKDISTISHSDTAQILSLEEMNIQAKSLASDIDSIVFIDSDTINISDYAYFTCPDDHHPHMIDLGLPSGTLWSCCNVDATNPEEYGGYYAWGETEVKDVYNWNTYKFCDGSVETCHHIGYDIGGTKYDVAQVKWGGTWRLPSYDLFQELMDNCTFSLITKNGVYGGLFTGNNGASLFLPAAGTFSDNYIDGQGNYGIYWSSSGNVAYGKQYAGDFYFNSRYIMWHDDIRCQGFPVRPVFVASKKCPVADAIDLGLPSGTLWASWNVGASSPEEYGNYYAWGETEEKDYYSWDTYPYCEGTMATCQYFGNISGTTKDVASAKWGTPWRMPTSKEIDELRQSCSLETVNYNNVLCDKYIGPNGNYILIPYAGLMWYGGNTDKGIEVRYWSSEQHPDYHYQACHLYQQGTIGNSFLFEGFPVRPVRDPLGLSLSEDSVNVFVEATTTVTIESGSGDYELNKDKPEIIDAKLVLADKENYPNAKDEIQIFGKAEGSATLFVLDKKMNQTATLVVNVKTSTEEKPIAEAIDLGLPSGTKWASWNIGASTPEEYGGYYAWGETEEKDLYTEVTYQYSTGEDTDGDGWYDDYHREENNYGIWQDLGDNIACTQYDVAHQKWGEDWRMPTYYDFEELINHCSFQWTIVNGVNGGLFTSNKNGNSIFMPAAGYNWAGIKNDVANYGYYWSSTPYPDKSFAAYDLFFYSDNVTYWGWNNRSDGNCIRPVYDPWFSTPLSLSEDVVDVFVNSTATIYIESGRGLYELQYDQSGIIDAELYLADKEKYPDAKDGIQIFGIAEGTVNLKIVNKNNNQTAHLVVNVKTSTDEDLAITNVYIQSVRDFINLQDKLEVNTFQSNLISWLEEQNWVKKVHVSLDKDETDNVSKNRIKSNIQQSGDGTGSIDVTFINNANFCIMFYDISLSEEEGYDGHIDFSSYDRPLRNDVSSINGEIIIDNTNVLYIQGRTMPSFKNQYLSTAIEESEWIQSIKQLSPIDFTITPVIKELSFLDTDLSNYGMILLGQTHGCFDPDPNNLKLSGAFQVEDQYYKNSLDCGLTLIIKDHKIEESKEEAIVYNVSPLVIKNCNIKDNTIFYANYCYSYFMQYQIPNTTYFGYSTLAAYPIGSDQMVMFFGNMSEGNTYENAIDLNMKEYNFKNQNHLDIHVVPVTNRLFSKQRFFSISTEGIKDYTKEGNPIIKGKINGYQNLKPDINYYVYVFDSDETLNPEDIITNGKPININQDGTFEYTYSDLTVTQYSKKFKVVVGFNYGGITYHGPIKEVIIGLCPDDKHPHMIYMGSYIGSSPLMWSCCNVGANSPEEYGGYYAWGETEEKDYYGFSNYFDGNYKHIGNDISGTKYDVAHVKWGDDWRMPSYDFLKIFMRYKRIRITLNGIDGELVIGSNGATLFLPAAGWRKEEKIINQGRAVTFWTSSLVQPYEGYNYYFEDQVWVYDEGSSIYLRYYGFPVRPYHL